MRVSLIRHAESEDNAVEVNGQHRMTRAEWQDLRTLAPLLTGLVRDALDLTRELGDVAGRATRGRSHMSEEDRRTVWGVAMAERYRARLRPGGPNRTRGRCIASRRAKAHETRWDPRNSQASLRSSVFICAHLWLGEPGRVVSHG